MLGGGEGKGLTYKPYALNFSLIIFSAVACKGFGLSDKFKAINMYSEQIDVIVWQVISFSSNLCH
jgi:hypothetical protein